MVGAKSVISWARAWNSGDVSRITFGKRFFDITVGLLLREFSVFVTVAKYIAAVAK